MQRGRSQGARGQIAAQVERHGAQELRLLARHEELRRRIGLDLAVLGVAHDGDDFHVERFEFFVGGMEMGNAFTELNDPRDQEQRFLDMQRLYGDEDDETTPLARAAAGRPRQPR